MFRHYISADVPAPRTGPRRHGLINRGLALCSLSMAHNQLWIQTHLQQMRHVRCLAEIGAECPWSPVKTAQSCLLLILHASPWHLRAGKHRHARPTMRHHDPLVTKLLQQRVVWKCEVVLKIVVDLFILFLFRCTRACSTRTHMRRRAHVCVCVCVRCC